MDPEAEARYLQNEAMRQPLNPAFALLRVGFAVVSGGLCLGAAPAWLVGLWALVWAINFGKDLLMGITPMQTIFGCAFGLVGWGLWAGMVAAAIF